MRNKVNGRIRHQLTRAGDETAVAGDENSAAGPHSTPFSPVHLCEMCGAPIPGVFDISLFPPTAGALLLCRTCTVRFDTGTGGFMVTPDIGIIDWCGDYANSEDGISVAERETPAKTEPEIQDRRMLFWD